jgi:hypothetical protein
MKRLLLILAAVGLFCMAVEQAQAHNYYAYGPHCRAWAYHHVPPPAARVIVTPPAVVVPAPPPRTVYRYYNDSPASGFLFHYQGRRVAVDIGL